MENLFAKFTISVFPKWLSDKLKTATESLNHNKNLLDQNLAITLSAEEEKINKIVELEKILAELKNDLGEKLPSVREKRNVEFEKEISNKEKELNEINRYMDLGGPYPDYNYDRDDD